MKLWITCFALVMASFEQLHAWSTVSEGLNYHLDVLQGITGRIPVYIQPSGGRLRSIISRLFPGERIMVVYFAPYGWNGAVPLYDETTQTKTDLHGVVSRNGIASITSMDFYTQSTTYAELESALADYKYATCPAGFRGSQDTTLKKWIPDPNQWVTFEVVIACIMRKRVD
jgi:hypothetical protein